MRFGPDTLLKLRQRDADAVELVRLCLDSVQGLRSFVGDFVVTTTPNRFEEKAIDDRLLSGYNFFEDRHANSKTTTYEPDRGDAYVLDAR